MIPLKTALTRITIFSLIWTLLLVMVSYACDIMSRGAPANLVAGILTVPMSLVFLMGGMWASGTSSLVAKCTACWFCMMNQITIAKLFALLVWEDDGENRQIVRVIFQDACYYGRLEMAQWLAAKFHLTPADARARDNIALVLACDGGHLHVARWLFEAFHLTAADARARDNSAIMDACSDGNYEMLAWLIDTVHLTAADARCHNDVPFNIAYHRGHNEILALLDDRFGINPEMVPVYRAIG